MSGACDECGWAPCHCLEVKEQMAKEEKRMNWWERIRDGLRRFRCLWFPLFQLHLRIPFFEIRTEAMSRQIWDQSFQYVAWYIRIHKWEFMVNLYDTDKRRIIRKCSKD